MSATPPHPLAPIHGRGAPTHPPTRFEPLLLTPDPDYLASLSSDPDDADAARPHQIRTLFRATTRRAGLNQEHHPVSTAAFRRPGGEPLSLF